MDQNDRIQEKEGKKVKKRNYTNRRNLIKDSRKYNKRIK